MFDYLAKPPLALFKSKDVEEQINSYKFTVHKFNSRIKPSKDKVKIICCFSEFGCETIGCMYCIPRLLKGMQGKYVIAVGWHGREYLYRHLVDEFWEIDESLMWLKEYSRAFHFFSKNLKTLEKTLGNFGEVYPSSSLGTYAITNMCRTCGKSWKEWMKKIDVCPSCKSTVVINSIFSDTNKFKKQAVRIPPPRSDVMEWADSFLPPNCVGIFARNRKTYGRNMPSEFYINLINLLKSKGYNPIWLGEKSSTLSCPVDDIIDFSRMEDSRDLEKTIALVSMMKFTIQFWTASSRISGMTGTPFILFESPEQIYASKFGASAAQEGKRIDLSSLGPRKIVLSHFRSSLENQGETLNYVNRAIDEINENNWEDIVALVKDYKFITLLQKEFYETLK